jgi:hypothetical protein
VTKRLREPTSGTTVMMASLVLMAVPFSCVMRIRVLNERLPKPPALRPGFAAAGGLCHVEKSPSGYGGR